MKDNEHQSRDGHHNEHHEESDRDRHHEFHHLSQRFDTIEAMLRDIVSWISGLNKAEIRRDKTMSAEMDRIRREVTESRTMVGSIATFVSGLAQQIRDLREDPAALAALADELESQQVDMAAMIAANTEGAPVLETPIEVETAAELAASQEAARAEAERVATLANPAPTRTDGESEADFNLRVEANRVKTAEDIRIAIENLKVSPAARARMGTTTAKALAARRSGVAGVQNEANRLANERASFAPLVQAPGESGTAFLARSAEAKRVQSVAARNTETAASAKLRA